MECHHSETHLRILGCCMTLTFECFEGGGELEVPDQVTIAIEKVEEVVHIGNFDRRYRQET